MYHKILFSDDARFGVAYLRPGKRSAVCFPEGDLLWLPYQGMVEDWEQLRLNLQDGEFSDYLASDLGCRMCSLKLKEVLQAHATGNDHLQWLPVTVHHGREKRVYFILHFPNPPDVLNPDRTLFTNGVVLKAALDREKVAGHEVLTYPEGGNIVLYVSEGVRAAIEAAGCTGNHFGNLPVY